MNDEYLLELMAFSAVLRHEGKACFSRGESLEAVRGIIKNVREAADKMTDACDKQELSNLQNLQMPAGIKELTPEEYEAKVAAGKKLTFSPDPGSKMKQGD